MNDVYELVYTIQDARGRRGTHTLYVPGADGDPGLFGRADVVLFAQSYASLLDDVIAGQIMGVTIQTEVSLVGLGLSGGSDPNADVEERMEVAFTLPGHTGGSYVVTVPAVKENLFVAGRFQRTLPQAHEWLTFWLDPEAKGYDLYLSNARGYAVQKLYSTRKVFSGSRFRSRR